MKNKYEDIDEVLYRAAIIEANEELNSIPPRKELEAKYTFSDQHKQRMQRLFSENGKGQTQRRKKKVRYRYIAAVVVCVAALYAIMTFEANRAITETTAAWEIQYIPQGFELEDTVIADDRTELVYQSDEGQAISVISKLSDGADLMTTTVIGYRTVVLDGIEYTQIFSIDGIPCNIITWTNFGREFEVTATAAISVDELMDVALSVKPLND